MKKFNRREFLGLATAGLALAGCGTGLEERVEEDSMTQQEREPIIDIHFHALPSNFYGDPPITISVPVAPAQSVTDYVSPITDEDLMRESLAAMERYNIVRAVASGPLEYVKRWRSEAPDQIIPALSFLHPDEVDIDSLEEEFRSGDLAMLGEIVTQYHGLSPSGPELDPFLALAEEYDIPVGMHMFTAGSGAYENFPKYRASLTNPLLWEEALIRHPKLRLDIMHAAWPMLSETIHLLYSYPQVYVDVGMINWLIPRKAFHSYLHDLIEAGLSKKVMFGSDQLIWPGVIGPSIEAVESADFLTKEQKRDIFYNNAARFLRLEDKKNETIQ